MQLIYVSLLGNERSEKIKTKKPNHHKLDFYHQSEYEKKWKKNPQINILHARVFFSLFQFGGIFFLMKINFS